MENKLPRRGNNLRAIRFCMHMSAYTRSCFQFRVVYKWYFPLRALSYRLAFIAAHVVG